ncbi:MULTISPECIES: exopolysaccharide production repressor protein [Shinella]|jgi:exopolysaccharide production repressor protein|uniref:Exopolysaccharide production repressor n=1 Tax=Shinella granuli TaxID=323621 RepID=A0A4R2CU77_SHIGR|nr:MULTISPECIES: exopolysaccharide production repressor protein [Shinella]TCN44907.1 exopolysaccharide production repressor [Shinella granuli]
MTRVPDKKWRDSMAYAPRFFLSMAIALVAFAVVTYLSTGSLATTALQTFLCAVLIQVGYFLTTLFLVWREARQRRRGIDAGARGTPDIDTSRDAAKSKVPVSMNEPGHSKP